MQTIQGMQGSGVQACAKHFSKITMNKVASDLTELILRATVGNEQELNRETMSSNIDDRTLHEVYD